MRTTNIQESGRFLFLVFYVVSNSGRNPKTVGNRQKSDVLWIDLRHNSDSFRIHFGQMLPPLLRQLPQSVVGFDDHF
jgi:hypothetical protein